MLFWYLCTCKCNFPNLVVWLSVAKGSQLSPGKDIRNTILQKGVEQCCTVNDPSVMTSYL